MTYRPSRWLLADNELIHCQTFAQLPIVNSLEGNPDSLKDAERPSLMTSGLYNSCNNQHGKGVAADSGQEFNIGPITPDTTVRPEVKDSTGEQMIESGEVVISPLKGYFNESSANATCSKVMVTSETTWVMRDRGQRVEVQTNSARDGENGIDSIHISSPTTNDHRKDEIDNDVEQIIESCISLPSPGLQSIDNGNLIATKWCPTSETSEIQDCHNADAIKTSESDNVQENVPGECTQKEIIKNNFNSPCEKVPANLTQASIITPEEARRPTRSVMKRGTSSNIRKIQEAIIKEQSKEPIKKSLTDIHEQDKDGDVTVCPLSTNVLGVGRNIRRQRSKSKTKYSKMNYDQLQRPYRRWLGVSTCIASDTRFIVEPESQSKNISVERYGGDTHDTVQAADTEANKTPDTDEKIRDIVESDKGNLATPSPGKEHVASYEEERILLLDDSCGTTDTCAAHVTYKTDVTSKATETCAAIRESLNNICAANLISTDAANDKNINEEHVKPLTFEPGLSFEKLVPPISGAGTKYDEQLKDKGQECMHKEGRKSVDTTDECYDYIREDGGLAGNAVSKASYEFDTKTSFIPDDYDPKPEGIKILTWELKKYGDPEMLPKKAQRQRYTALQSFKAKLRQSHTKADYINVQAIKNCDGKLPGQLSYKKGQIIKQLDIGLTAPDGMFYGYYRVGKLRRKVCGIYPCSHVTPVIECSDDSDDDSKMSQPKPTKRNVKKVSTEHK